MSTDALGNAVSLDQAASLGPLNDFVEGFIACEARAVNVLSLADADHSPIAQACVAALHMFAETGDAPVNARPFIDRAVAGAPGVSARERRFVDAVRAWVEGDMPLAIALHEQQAREHPRDLVSVKLGQYHAFNRGDAPTMLRLSQHALPAAADVPYVHGMAAFGWEQCHDLESAESSARRGIAMVRKEPWAHHALAHVMLTQGRIEEGHAFLADVSDTWHGLNSFMVTHNWWHQALFALARDDVGEALALYDTQVWGVAKDYSQDQVNAVSLLARVELAGGEVGDRWCELGGFLRGRTQDHVLPFLDVQYLYGLARAGLPQADQLMAHLERHAREAPPHSRDAWLQVALPAARGMLAHARGDFSDAARQLGAALPSLERIGGSHAQRDLFVQLHDDALRRA